MTNSEFLSELEPADVDFIEDLAAQNHGPSEIAKLLNKNRRAFLRIWRDKKSLVREAYERGLARIEQDKRESLEEKVIKGSLKAIEIHDRRSSEQRFEDIKRDIFNIE